jgi:hypothetical protein
MIDQGQSSEIRFLNTTLQYTMAWHWLKRSAFGILIFAFCSTALSKPKDFMVSLPSSWKMIQNNREGLIYINRKSPKREIIVLRKIQLGTTTHMSPRQLIHERPKIQEMRAKILRDLGIGAYSIIDISMKNRAPGKKDFNSILTLESRYKSLSHNEVISIERHYFIKGEIYQVFYSQEGETLGNRQRVESFVDSILPVSSVKAPRKTVLFLDNLLKEALAAETGAGGPGYEKNFQKDTSDLTCGTKEPRSFNFNDPETVKSCSRLAKPEEVRTSADPPLFSADGATQFPWGCMTGAKDVAESSAKGAWSLYTGYVKSMTGYNAYKYYTDPAFKAESDATTAAMSEAAKDPIRFAQNKAHQLYCFVSNQVEAFPCLKPQLQYKVLCKLAIDVGLTVSAGAGIFKIARGLASATDVANLTRAAEGEVSSAINEGTRGGEAANAAAHQSAPAAARPGPPANPASSGATSIDAAELGAAHAPAPVTYADLAKRLQSEGIPFSTNLNTVGPTKFSEAAMRGTNDRLAFVAPVADSAGQMVLRISPDSAEAAKLALQHNGMNIVSEGTSRGLNTITFSTPGGLGSAQTGKALEAIAQSIGVTFPNKSIPTVSSLQSAINGSGNVFRENLVTNPADVSAIGRQSILRVHNDKFFSIGKVQGVESQYRITVSTAGPGASTTAAKVESTLRSFGIQIIRPPTLSRGAQSELIIAIPPNMTPEQAGEALRAATEG